MANPNKNVEKADQQSQNQGGQLNEASPNPQGQSTVTEMPLRTDHGQVTGGENIGQSTSTREGKLNPSVADHVSGNVENTSMFNNADPQTAAILDRETKEKNEAARLEHERNAPKEKKSA